MTPSLIARWSFVAQALVDAHPPRLLDRNKHVVHGIACPPGAHHAGRLEVSRWRADALPEVVPPANAPVVEPRGDFYTYDAAPAGTVAWHLNFADARLFGFYGGPLLAQDELQVAEHPVLASVREALEAEGQARTVEGGRPTPVLVRGAERRCRLRGLYGNAFAAAGSAAVATATQPIVPPTVTNIVAIEAIPGGRGRYTRQEIAYTLLTAYAGFAAARAESAGDGEPQPAVVVHTGWWGCGAYGGDRVLMAALQVLAARLAGVDRLVFHTGDGDSARLLGEALHVAEAAAPAGAERRETVVVAALEAQGREWGRGNGT